MQSESTIVISSTFAADPIAESVNFWLEHMEMPARVSFARPLQLVQTLLDPTSLFGTNAVGLNVALLRWEDLDYRGEAERDRPLNDVAAALRASDARAKVPHLVITCPASPLPTPAARSRLYSEWDRRLVEELDAYPNVWVMTSDELQTLYPVSNLHDSYGNEIALIPYSPAMFAAMGTVISLWAGICGEEGPHGVRVDQPHAALQEFLVAQYQQGVLICLCSKNNQEDVEAVFRQRGGMPLRWDHVAACRINWAPKPENLLSIAEELALGTDSFIFLDDNPVECEAMRQSLPNVLTLQIPSDRNNTPEFLRRVWAFDRREATNEDKERTALYRQAREREQLRKSSASLEEFLAGLELKVKFEPLGDTNLARASQLTFRVNQFNLTTIRRTEAELATLLRAGDLNGLAVDVSDRFGDYGFVGLILFASTSDALQVDTFLLSCRALGRGVEHRILAELGALAKSMGLATIDLRLVPTGKNQPARDFLETDLGSYQQPREGTIAYRLPVNLAVTIRYRPGRTKELPAHQQLSARVSAAGDAMLHASRASRLAWIASEMPDADKILAAIQAWKRKQRPGPEAAFISPRTDLERKLADIWAEVLGLEKVGVRDNFFELGGDSLAVVRVIVRVYEARGVEFSIPAFFESPTIEEHAIKIAALELRGGE
ncbi:MAG: HAD-IIIC family phosphatase [Deltaproteobacteria bacterium]|nr:HAD-IIIC family phosphatase [Deltaproteobacteria bacterium]